MNCHHHNMTIIIMNNDMLINEKAAKSYFCYVEWKLA